MALHVYTVRGEAHDGTEHSHTRLRFISIPDPAAAILPDGQRHLSTHHIRLSIWSAALLLLWLALAAALPAIIFWIVITILFAVSGGLI